MAIRRALALLRGRDLAELWRFYQAAIVNTLFGYGLFALLIALHVPLFAAQTIAFLCGVGFNYLIYSRHVFRSGERSGLRFAAAYGLNYLVNIGLLWMFAQIVHNAYLCGAAASLIASLINYFALKHAVFVDRRA